MRYLFKGEYGEEVLDLPMRCAACGENVTAQDFANGNHRTYFDRTGAGNHVTVHSHHYFTPMPMLKADEYAATHAAHVQAISAANGINYR